MSDVPVRGVAAAQSFQDVSQRPRQRHQHVRTISCKMVWQGERGGGWGDEGEVGDGGEDGSSLDAGAGQDCVRLG